MKILTPIKFMAAASVVIGLTACITMPDDQGQQAADPPTPLASQEQSQQPSEQDQPQSDQPHRRPPRPPHVPVTPASGSAPGTVRPIAPERTLEEGVNLYDNGKYTEALKKFQAPEISKAGPQLRSRALKYSAFSYCVQNKLQACQKAFHDALQIDPQFQLKPSEKSHPLWGPAFQRAQAELSKPATSPSSPQQQPPQPAGQR